MDKMILPSSWNESTLGNLAIFIMGQAPKSANCNVEGHGEVFVKAGEFGKLTPVVREWTTEPLKMADETDVLICVVGATSGKINLGIKCAIGRSVAAIRPNNYLNQKYLYRFLETQVLNLRSKSTGSAQGVISRSDLENIVIPFCTYTEQKVIAEKLDDILAKVERIKARLERIPQILKQFRQSVLADAISGKLTEDWRGGSEFEINETIFGDLVLSSIVGLVRSAGEQYEESNGKYAYIKMNNIDNFWGYNLNNLRYVNATADEITKYKLEYNDWIFNTRNSLELVGKSCVWKLKGVYVFNNNILRVKFKNAVIPDFIEVFLKSAQGQQTINAVKSGTTNVAAVYQKQLFQLKIKFPNIDEQYEIVRRVEQLFSTAESVEQHAIEALKRVNDLTQSILAKAFKGELTEEWRKQNPDLISGKNSAEALRAKIKAEIKKK